MTPIGTLNRNEVTVELDVRADLTKKEEKAKKGNAAARTAKPAKCK